VWLDPKDAKAHAAAGQSYVRLSKWPEAISALQRALALDSGLREARYALGTTLMRTGNTDDARRELELFARQQAEAEAAGSASSNSMRCAGRRRKEALAGDLEKAVARYQEVAAIDPGARSQRDLGVALLRAKRFSEAIERNTGGASDGGDRRGLSLSCRRVSRCGEHRGREPTAHALSRNRRAEEWNASGNWEAR
jgi:tetratricopeptide (TPR) repeat protein